MPDKCMELFHFAAGLVTVEDIVAFAPNDPGYDNYVRTYRAILTSRQLPLVVDFDLTETIGLTWWSDASKIGLRFRKFRTFTNVVGIGVIATGDRNDYIMSPNYFAISLIDDAYALQDSGLWAMLEGVFEEFHGVLRRFGDAESPLVLLGLLLVKVHLGCSGREMEALAEQIMKEEAEYPRQGSWEFLWSCTNSDLMNQKWREFIRRFLGSASGGMRFLRDALLATDAGLE